VEGAYSNMSCTIVVEEGRQKSKSLSYTGSTNVKLFGAQRRETARPLQFLELMKATFDCGRNTRQRSAGVRRHEGNSLGPKKDNFLKLMMQSSRFFQERHKTELFVNYDLLREEAIKKVKSLNIPRSRFKAIKGWTIMFMRQWSWCCGVG
jgi:hypothetical protein